MRLKKKIKIAIDSPAGAGAGTQAKLISKHYNLFYLDTGKIYRLIGLTKLQNPKNLLEKIRSSSHGEHNLPEFTWESKITEKIEMQKNIFDLEYTYKKVEIDDTFPKYIVENQEKLKEWII